MRTTFYSIVVFSMAVLAFAGSGCSERRTSEPVEDLSLKRASFKRLVRNDGSIAGYVEDCATDRGRKLRFVFNSRLDKVGFITSGSETYRYLATGEKSFYGLFPDGGGEAALLGVSGPLTELGSNEELRTPPERTHGKLKKIEE